jgi:ATP-binding protein involved in chromosome partitioning
MKEDAHCAVRPLPGVERVEVRMGSKVRATSSEEKDKLVPLVKNVVPVGSGKGGVGKSTVSANLAIALAKLGAKVGLLDADVYGPSIPTIMGAHVPPTAGNGNIIPVLRYGVEIVSIGFFVPKGEATIWRGPMLSKVVEKFLGGVEWGELDYLLVDLPPGTGDVQLSLCQMIPLTGAAIVSTPQDLAFNVAEKAIFMFTKLRTPVLGLVENMSGFECRHCGHREEIFGSGGARRFAMANEILPRRDPLSAEIRTASDEGYPIVESMPESPVPAPSFGSPRISRRRSAPSLWAESQRSAGDRGDYAPSTSDVRILWKDGHESLYTGYALRWGVGARCASTRCRDKRFARNRSARMSVRSPSTRWAGMRSASSGATGTRPASTRSSFCASCAPARSAQKKAKHKHDRSRGNRRCILRLHGDRTNGLIGRPSRMLSLETEDPTGGGMKIVCAHQAGRPRGTRSPGCAENALGSRPFLEGEGHEPLPSLTRRSARPEARGRRRARGRPSGRRT